MNGGTVTNGKFFIAGTSTATFNNTHIVSWASITANSIFLTLSTFDDSIKFVKKGTSPNVSKGGNTFNGFVSIIDSSSGPLIFADSLPDTFNSNIQVGGTSTGYVYLAHRAQGNVFNGVVTVNYGAVFFNQYGTANFNNNIVLNCAGSGPSNGVMFGSSTGACTLATGKSIKIGSSGFSKGILQLKNFTVQDVNNLDTLSLTGTSQLQIDGSAINSKLFLSGPNIQVKASRFNNTLSIVQSGSATVTSLGGNYFSGEVSLKNTGTGTIGFSTTNVDSFMSKVTLWSSGGIVNVNNAHFNDSVFLKNTGSVSSVNYLNLATTGNCIFKKYVSIDNSSSNLTFGLSGGTVTFDTTSSIAFTSSCTGSLNWNKVIKQSTQSLNISQPSLTKFTLGNGSVLNGKFLFYSKGISLNGCTFNDTVNIFRFGTASDVSNGGNIFNGPTTIEDSSNNSHTFTMGNTASDYFNNDVTFIHKSSTGNMYLANSRKSYFAKKLTVNCSGSTVSMGNGTGGKTVFNGNTNQSITVTSGNPNFKRVEVNKSSGKLVLLSPVSISDSLVLLKGIISTDTSNILIILDNCKATGGSDSSFVEGPIKKIGNDDFKFPIGSSSFLTPYHPLSISAPSSISSEIIAKYFSLGHKSNNIFDSLQLSYAEYWQLIQIVGNSTAMSVSLGWNGNSPLMEDTSQNVVCSYYIGTSYDKGKNSIIKSGYSGIITSTSTIALTQGQQQDFSIARQMSITGGSLVDSFPYRGMYVNYFAPRDGFWWDDNGTQRWQDPNFTHILGDSALENSLLQYALENNIKRLDLFELRYFLSNLNGINPKSGNKWKDDLCSFINRARTSYCIKEISAVGGWDSSFFIQLDTNHLIRLWTPPYNLNSSSISHLRDSLPYLSFIETTDTSSVYKFLLSELIKFYLRVNDYNNSASSIGGTSSCTFNVLATEIEWWWKDRTIQGKPISFKWPLFVNITDFLRDLQTVSPHHFKIHNYIGYIQKLFTSTDSISVDSLLETDVADLVDANSDKVYLVNYQNDTTNLWNNPQCPTCFTHSLDLLGHNAIQHSDISPLFSCEANSAGVWLNANERNTIQSYEKLGFFDRSLNFTSLIGDNIITPGSVQWFTYTWGRQKPTLWQDSNSVFRNLWQDVPPPYSSIGYNFCTNNVPFQVNISGAPQICHSPNDTIYVCVNTPVEFIFCSNYEDSVFYDFYFGDGDTLLHQLPVDTSSGQYTHLSHTYIQPDTFTIRCDINFSYDSTFSHSCKYSNFNRTIVVRGPILTLNSSDISCFGEEDGSASISVTNGSALYHYLWSNSDTTNSINNLDTGFYSCVVTDANNCSATVSVTITQPPALVFSASGTSSVSVCNGSVTTSISGGTPPYNYIWNNNVNLDSSSYNNWLCPGTYIIEVTDSSGCVSSDTVSIGLITSAACTTSIELFIATDETSKFINDFNLYNPGDDVFINGNFTIDEDFDFSSSNVFIAPNVTVTVSPGTSGNHTIFVVDSSTLQACSTPWQGIVATNAFTELIFNHSVIRDALLAVDASNSVNMEVTHNQFLHNLVSFFIHDGNYSTSLFSGNEFNYLNATLDDPTADAHISIIDADNVTIGGLTGFPYENEFLNAKYGITADGTTDVNIQYNTFHNLGYHYIDDAYVQRTGGAAIRSSSPLTSPTVFSTLVVGDHLSGAPNIFSDMEAVCILTEEQVQSNISGNQFSNISYGFGANDSRTCKVTAEGNVFLNFGTGIQVYNSFHDPSGATGNGLVRISENIFNMVSVSTNPNNSVPTDYSNLDTYGFLAIDVQSTLPNSNLVDVSNNWIANSRYGIMLRNILSNTLNTDVVLKENQVFYTRPAYEMSGHEIGIRLENSNGLLIESNHIYASDFAYNFNDAKHLFGLSLDRVTHSTIKENYIKYMGFGLRGTGLCTNTELHCNNFLRNWHGVYGSRFGLAPQGNPVSDEAWDNYFDDFQQSNNRVAGILPLNIINWYYQSADPQLEPIGPPTIVFEIIASNEDTTCDRPVFSTPEVERDYNFYKIVNNTDTIFNDSIYYHYYLSDYFYKLITTNTSILNTESESDDVYQQYYDSLTNTNHKLFNDVAFYLNEKNFDESKAILENIVEENSFEGKLKAVFTILVEAEMKPKEINIEQSILLESLSEEKPIFSGEVVYVARAFLRKYNIDEYEEGENIRLRNPRGQENSSRETDIEFNDLVKEIGVFPNPTNNLFRIMIENPLESKLDCRLFDMYGRMLSLYILPTGTTSYKIDCSNLESGSYLLNFSYNNNLIKKEIIIVNK